MMPIINIEMDFDAIAFAGIVASTLGVLCWHEYQSIKSDNKALLEELENPPEQVYKHDLKAFSKPIDK